MCFVVEFANTERPCLEILTLSRSMLGAAIVRQNHLISPCPQFTTCVQCLWEGSLETPLEPAGKRLSLTVPARHPRDLILPWQKFKHCWLNRRQTKQAERSQLLLKPVPCPRGSSSLWQKCTPASTKKRQRQFYPPFPALISALHSL